MSRTSVGTRAVATVAVCLLLAAPAAGAPAEKAGAGPPARAQTARYIVVLHAETDLRSVIDERAGAVRAGRRYTRVFNGFTARMTPEAAAALAADPRVETVEADGWMQRADAQRRPTWGLDRIDQPTANLDNTYAYSTAGRGVTAYVVDGGIYGRHREFGDRVRSGFDVTGRNARRDCDGHGTHIAGTLGGRRFGVAKKVRLVPVRVVGCAKYMRRSNILAGLDYVIRDHRKHTPAVANLSFGGPASAVMDRAVNRLIDDGITVVAAAGNLGTDACSSSPGRVPRAITVGAVNRVNWSPNWSNYGRCIDIFAPGVGITSAGTSSTTASRRLAGTSMAAPHVAGAAARYLSAHRSAGPGAVTRHLLRAALPRVRNAGWFTTTKMLYVPGRVPTKLTVRKSRDWVDPDDEVTVTARLRNRLTGAQLGGQRVVLQGRRAGARSWNVLTSRTTRGDDPTSFTHRPRRAMEYRWRHAGTARTRAATSGVSAVGFRRWRTELQFYDNLTGRLTALQDYSVYGLKGFTVELQSRPVLTDKWSVVARQTSADGGYVDFSEEGPLPGMKYRLRHARTRTTQSSTSGVLP